MARLYTETDFLHKLSEQFDGDLRLSFHLAPPGFTKPGPDGRPKKITFGPWLLPVLKWLAKARRLRGSWLDPFRFGHERAVDRNLLNDYEADLDLLLKRSGQASVMLQLANWPAEVRGFGPIRQQAADKARQVRQTARAALMA